MTRCRTSRYWPALVIVLALIAFALGRPTAASATPESQTPSATAPVLAYYYLWYEPASWNRAKIDYPAIGRYSSSDPTVIRRQIQEAKQAGITGFIVSWKDTPTDDQRLRLLIQIAGQEHFKLGITYEAQDFQRKPLGDAVVAAGLKKFATEYADSPVFHIFTKPLVIWSGTWDYSVQAIRQVLAPVRHQLMVLASEKDVAGYLRVHTLVDGDAYYWSSVYPGQTPGYETKLTAMANAVHRNGGIWIAPFAPGYNALLIGGSRVVPRDNGQTLKKEYAAAVTSSPDALGLISWNEFTENTYVEPSVHYGNRALAVLAGLLKAPAPTTGVFPLDSSASGSSGPNTLAVLVILALALAVAIVVAGRRRRQTSPDSDGQSEARTKKSRSGPKTRPRRRWWVVAAVIAVAGLAAYFLLVNPTGAPAYPKGTASSFMGSMRVANPKAVVVGAAGDISCPTNQVGMGETADGPSRGLTCQAGHTAGLMMSMRPDAVMDLGDDQYPSGILTQFEHSYATTWGKFKTITYPVPGNHEYLSPGARGYYAYFGPHVGKPSQGWYSYNLGTWHIVALNAECEYIGGCNFGSPEERWLRADLANHPAACTLAYWHQPRFSSGEHGDNPTYNAFWTDLYNAGADVILNGHDHDYERFAPLDPQGSVDPSRGIREFVAGTGGASHYEFHQVQTGSQKRIENVFGVLRLTLRPNSYNWAFMPESGPTPLDAGSATCH